MRISTLHLAELARLDLTKEEHAELSGDLERILAYVEELKNVPTEHIATMTHAAPEVDVLRPEDNTKVLIEEDATALTAAFPEKENNFLRVPLVLDFNE